MDWLKLFALLIATAVTSVQVSAEGPKKKIRIHIPQNVKHIHHHKKIYITNHPASSQYAPAYMPSAEGAVAVPTNIALPAVASVVPLSSVEIYEESQTRQPGAPVTASKLLPLYHARGYYGPSPTVFENQEFDLVPPRETLDLSHIPTSFVKPPRAGTSPHIQPPKKVKIVKINETPRKKIIRNTKPKPVVVQGRPQLEEEHPVSVFHEKFYSDVDESGTIKKIKKPPRVEKIIDGNTEHIHTYTEEHIHKLVFDNGPKSSSIHPTQHSLVPIRHPQTILAFSPDSLTGYTAVGSMGTPSHLEYSGYNPSDVTHDHIFHDHGEMPSELDISRAPLPKPPRISHGNQGTRIGGSKNKIKSKYLNRYVKSTDAPLEDLSFYENMYSSLHKAKKPKPQITSYDTSFEDLLKDFRPVPEFSFKNKRVKKPKNMLGTFDFDHEKQESDYLKPQTGIPAPFSFSTGFQNYRPKKSFNGRGTTGFSNFNDPLLNFKDNSYTSNFDFDTSASSSNIVTYENKNHHMSTKLLNKQGKKKSIPSQTTKLGGSNDQTSDEHWKDLHIAITQNDESPSGFDYYNIEQPQTIDTATPTSHIVKESSPEHSYYSAMAIKALGSTPQALSDSLHYVEEPTPATIPPIPSIATTTETSELSNTVSRDVVETEQPKYQVAEIRQRKHNRGINFDGSSINRPRKRFQTLEPNSLSEVNNERESGTGSILNESRNKFSFNLGPVVTSELKYGDKI